MDQARWARSQGFELAYHSQDRLRSNDELWDSESLKLLTGLGLDMSMKGKRILDVGCGSRLRARRLLENNIVVGTDPLADQFKTIPFSDLRLTKVLNAKAEDLLEELVEGFDVCLSLNVLDHCVNPALAVKRMGQYLKKDGLLYMWTDLGHNDHMHDGSMTTGELETMVKEAGLTIQRMTVNIDPYDFSRQEEKNYRRCGVPCLPGVSCVVVVAVK